MWRALREHLDEPVPVRPTRPSRADGVLSGLAAACAVVEGLVRDGAVVAVAGAVVMAAMLRMRRTRPLVALAVAFGVASGLAIGDWMGALPARDLYTGIVVLLLPYALLRYGSGREVALGLATVLATYVISAATGHMHDAGDAIGSFVVLFFPAAIGASVRFRDRAHRHEVERTQQRERQMLARELHDTVAHHLAAIAVQTQAARVSFARRPDAAVAALGAIETEASRALAELRGLVGALREDGPASLGPQGSIEAIEALVSATGEHARFDREGDVGSLSPAVALAVHRIAKESLHNTARHARGVRSVHVRIAVEGDAVRLVVRDDGERVRGSTGTGGFGLVGMKERALLLGGTLEAGPAPDGGWKVEAVLPRSGPSGGPS